MQCRTPGSISVGCPQNSWDDQKSQFHHFFNMYDLVEVPAAIVLERRLHVSH